MDRQERAPRVAVDAAESVAPSRRTPAAASRPVVRRKFVVGHVEESAAAKAPPSADTLVRRVWSSSLPQWRDKQPDSGRIRRRAGVGAGAGAGVGAEVGVEGGQISSDTESRIDAARGGGSPLAPEIAQRFGDALGAGLDDVRVHRGTESHDLNARIQARAFTVGNDVFMGKSAPDVGTPSGDHLLAHELAHVVQQTGGAQRSMIHRAFKKSAAEDAALFELTPPVNAQIPLGKDSAAAKFGITQTNMEHYLERHTYKYQRLVGGTVKPAAGMFPVGTTADDVKSMLSEAIGKLPADAKIGTTPVSTSVDLANGLRVNLGALSGGKLQAFFPLPGGTNAGYHKYEAEDLKAIRDIKRPAAKKAAAPADKKAAAPAQKKGPAPAKKAAAPAPAKKAAPAPAKKAPAPAKKAAPAPAQKKKSGRK